MSGEPDAPSPTLVISAPGSFVSSAAPSPPRDPVSLGWPNCPAVTLTWLPFTVTVLMKPPTHPDHVGGRELPTQLLCLDPHSAPFSEMTSHLALE